MSVNPTEILIKWLWSSRLENYSYTHQLGKVEENDWANTFPNETAFHMSVTVKRYCYRVTNSDRSSTKRKLRMECVVLTQKCTSETSVLFTENPRKKVIWIWKCWDMTIFLWSARRLKYLPASWTVLTFNLCYTHWLPNFQQVEDQRRAEILTSPFNRFQPTAYSFCTTCIQNLKL
jgi:hypothetical protein